MRSSPDTSSASAWEAMMSDRSAQVRALLRRDLPSFINKCFVTLEAGRTFHPNWHIDHIGYQLSRVSDETVRRLIVNIPPRHLKSVCVTIAYTAWALGHKPSMKILAISYADALAEQHAIAFKTIVNSAWYQALFPDFQIARDRRSEIVTTQHGYRYAGSVGGSILGRGADLIVIDDPIKAQAALSSTERRKVNEFYDNTLYTRLNDKKRGAIVVVMQRLHQDDLVGHIMAKDDWELSAIPAIATEAQAYRTGLRSSDVYLRPAGSLIQDQREGRQELDQLRRTLGSMNFAAQYQQDPVPPDGNVIRRQWIRYYECLPACEMTIVSWDTASTLGERSDYSVGTVWGKHGSDFYLIDVVRGRFEVPELRKLVEETSLDTKAHVTLVEQTELGRAIVQDMRLHSPVRPILPKPLFGKEARLLAQAPKFEAGQVLLPKEAPWLADYLSELLAFPNGAHDDQVDSTSQALHYLSWRSSADNPPPRPNPTRPKGNRVPGPNSGE